MPILPPITSTPYDEIETILNFARVIANDAGLSLTGNLLSDSQPYTLTMLNLAWRKLQNKLTNNDIEEFPQEIIITGLPLQEAAAFVDPAIQAFLGFTGYNTGLSVYTNFFLPSDIEIPLRLWERVSGTYQEFMPMRAATDGLGVGPKSGLLRIWEWRGQSIYFLGANQVLDLRIRYKRILPDVAYPNTNQIPLIKCAVALAYLVVEIFAASRGSTILPTFTKEKDDAIEQMINSTVRKKQRSSFRRIPYSRRGRF